MSRKLLIKIMTDSVHDHTMYLSPDACLLELIGQIRKIGKQMIREVHIRVEEVCHWVDNISTNGNFFFSVFVPINVMSFKRHNRDFLNYRLFLKNWHIILNNKVISIFESSASIYFWLIYVLVVGDVFFFF